MTLRTAWVMLTIFSGAYSAGAAQTVSPSIRVEQATFGPRFHHFYGYIGHVGNTPWNGSGRHMVTLRTTFDDHMPGPGEAAASEPYRATARDRTG